MPPKRKSNKNPEIPLKRTKHDFFAPRAAPPAKHPVFSFEAKLDGSVRLVTWNVNGIKSVNAKILREYLKVEDPDMMILTETRTESEPDILCLKEHFKYRHWDPSTRSGKGGTAVLSKFKSAKPDIITGKTLCADGSDVIPGSYVEVEFDHYTIIGTYVPNSGDNFKNMEVKQRWNAAFSKRIHALNTTNPVIWAGDFNCVLCIKDLDERAGEYWNKMSGLSEIEREEFNTVLNPAPLLGEKFVDIWRERHPKAREFTHSSELFGAWRLDSFIVPSSIIDRVVRCEIRHELRDMKLSDHWPVVLDLRGPI